ncbi:UDP-N-acetylmuramoyl-tripeptide--D-alanyl-D-alanine ligase [Paenibacillus swuensis]|uniref:UDP-N-acetylmuramoyl-tripeptide--D-alanyl-D-alanine ligase n=1 Tax=Paenibacillus swuensis TaxID=1178515 RepID=A0A172TKM1_9BACL|nr:UDP-N-acetylmuramoyl-tripeptide--D-alanyl-D-alanine ligase [Paenibacillus swuensis]ANE47367.1 UDP-N-acetylmuramoyl-tripeptide--D-alanyl-D-alanine ligase [Paenibacillus swuensis]
MIKRTFAQVAQLCEGTLSAGAEQTPEQMIEGVTTDSRRIAQGNLFIPIQGDTFDGHDYVASAIAQGASLTLWQSGDRLPPEDIPYILVNDTLAALQKLASGYREQLGVRVVGVTGSNGKTTTKDMLASILATTYKVHKTQGNFNNHIGLPLTLLSMEEDTEMAVLEMGMSGFGEIQLLSDLAKPEAAIVTNIGESHLLQLGTRKGIAQAKLEIISGMKADGLLVYNGDEPLLEEVLTELQPSGQLLKFRFGMTESNDLYPVGLMMDSVGTRFTLNLPNASTLYIPLLGIHNVINALSAIAVSKFMGVSEADIARGLKDVKLTGMRIEVMKGVTGLTVLNDAYNASPTSVLAAIRLLEDLNTYRKKIIVLGDMLELGEDEIQFHREIGKSLTPAGVDYVYTFGKLAQFIAEEATHTFEQGRVKSFATKEDMVREISTIVSPAEDVVLVKGSRGMKLEDVVNGLLSMPL